MRQRVVTLRGESGLGGGLFDGLANCTMAQGVAWTGRHNFEGKFAIYCDERMRFRLGMKPTDVSTGSD